MNIRSQWKLLPILLTTVFLAGGSFFIVGYINKSVAERRSAELNKLLDQELAAIKENFAVAVDLLYDLRGLDYLEDVTPDRWKNYFGALLGEGHLQKYSFAYVEKVARDDLEKFEKKMRNSEDPLYKNYVVFPKTENAVAYPTKFLFTIDPEVKALLGFDFQYSTKSISAFATAMSTNQPTLSELTHLNLVVPSSKKTGYEVVLPVYKMTEIRNVPPDQRENLTRGFLRVWLNAESLGGNRVSIPGIRKTLLDGSEKIFSFGKLGADGPSLTISREVDLLNRKFMLVVESDKNFRLATFEENLLWMAPFAVVIINFLWILSVFIILSARQRAVKLANFAIRDLIKFKQAVGGVSDHVIIADPDGVIIYANNAASKITGYAVSEMIGKKPSLWGGQMTKEFYQKFWKIIKEDKEPYWGEIKNKRKNGELYEAEIHASPILGENKEVLFFVGIERDLTKTKAIEKMKTEFISLASHQLRTPLSAVKWFSEMLLDGNAGKLNKTQTEYVQKIEGSNEREIQLVNALLNVSRIESGKIVLTPKITSLKTLVEDLVGDLRLEEEWKDRKLTSTIEKSVPEIMIDPDLIKHVYTSLLTNAAKYTSKGDTISVKIYLKDENIISEVKDEGIGIPEKEQERIFEKFFRANNAMKKNTDGNGLGLYLTKSIVESSGGKIWFKSVEGEGTTFVFSLPTKMKEK